MEPFWGPKSGRQQLPPGQLHEAGHQLPLHLFLLVRPRGCPQLPRGVVPEKVFTTHMHRTVACKEPIHHVCGGNTFAVEL